MTTEFGKLLNDYRCKHNLSLMELAKIITGNKEKDKNCSMNSLLHKYEKGESLPVKTALIKRYAEVLGVGFDSLCEIIQRDRDASPKKAYKQIQKIDNLARCPKCGENTLYNKGDMKFCHSAICNYGFEVTTRQFEPEAMRGFDSKNFAQSHSFRAGRS